MTLRLRNRRQTPSSLPKDWREAVPDRPQPRRRLRGGRLVPVKADPVSRKARITTGVNSKAVRGQLDGRYAFARAVSTYEREYREHVGEDCSVALADMCRSAAIHKAVFNLALARVMDAGPLDDKDEARAAYEAWRRADSDLRQVLHVLGLQKRKKELPDLHTYLQQRAKEAE
jgi:hypothetical protein